MKTTTAIRFLGVALTAATLAACGGSDDNDAGNGALALSPSAIDLTGGGGACYSGFAYRVSVFGGAGPYSVRTDVPDALEFSRTSVDKNGTFDVTANGVCFDKGTITVIDQLNNRATLTITNKMGSTTTTP